MAIYAVGLAAARLGEYSLTITPATTVIDASSVKSAENAAKALLFDTFPTNDGWSGHTFVVSDVTDTVRLWMEK